jgi:hypothetical protein
MLVSNPEHFNQIGCHNNTALFLESSVFGQGDLVLPLRKGGFRSLQCRIFVWYNTFPVITFIIVVTPVESW